MARKKGPMVRVARRKFERMPFSWEPEIWPGRDKYIERESDGSEDVFFRSNYYDIKDAYINSITVGKFADVGTYWDQEEISYYLGSMNGHDNKRAKSWNVNIEWGGFSPFSIERTHVTNWDSRPLELPMLIERRQLSAPTRLVEAQEVLDAFLDIPIDRSTLNVSEDEERAILDFCQEYGGSGKETGSRFNELSSPIAFEPLGKFVGVHEIKESLINNVSRFLLPSEATEGEEWVSFPNQQWFNLMGRVFDYLSIDRYLSYREWDVFSNGCVDFYTHFKAQHGVLSFIENSYDDVRFSNEQRRKLGDMSLRIFGKPTIEMDSKTNKPILRIRSPYPVWDAAFQLWQENRPEETCQECGGMLGKPSAMRPEGAERVCRHCWKKVSVREKYDPEGAEMQRLNSAARVESYRRRVSS